MPDCETCKHPNTVHSTMGCEIDGCACDELILPAIAPDVPPPVPGACLHIFPQNEALWTIEEMDEIEEKINGSSTFIEVTICDFETVHGQSKPKYCTFPARIRPEAITSYHAFLPERWEKLLKDL